MAGKEENRIFVGGLSFGVTERELEHAFSPYGKILESQEVFLIMMERDTGRPRGFGFITFSDRRAMDEAIREMHGRVLGERTISVNRAQPKVGEDLDHGYRGSYPSGGRGRYAGGDKPVGQDGCFKCGRFGHWARECPSAGGGGGMYSSRSRYGGADDRGDRFRDRDRIIDDRYDGGRYGDRDRFDSRDDRYGNRDRFIGDRYPPTGDRFSDRYGGSDRFPQNGYGKERGFRDVASRGSGGVARNDGRSYRNRAGPYDRPGMGGRPSSYDRY